jgi:NifU-like protein
VTFYPQEIAKKLASLKYAARSGPANAVGTGAGLVCGSFVRFYLQIDTGTNEIENAAFKTNGCGFAIAGAELLAERLTGRSLTDLHGMDSGEFHAILAAEFGEYPEKRAHCFEIALDALRGALADFRALRLEEFRGERALICTCFGVSEDTIEQVITGRSPETVEEVSRLTRAGSGCGSCRMLIQEMLDHSASID